MMNIAVFASGRGSNFEAIAKSIKKGELQANLALLVCDNAKAGVLVKAKRAKIESLVIEREKFANKHDFERDIIKALKLRKIELIVLAGYMRILSSEFVQEYKNKIINIHPSLLPSFKGTQGIKDTFDYGSKIAGVTIHFIDEKLDHGPIIMQATIPIAEKDSLKTLEKKIHKLEHQIYPQAINLFVKHKLKTLGRKVRIY